MALLTLTLNNANPVLEKQHQETQIIHRYLNLAAQDVRSAGGKKINGNIVDNGIVVGSWVYAPQATS
jgi:hypothetical protein